MHNTTLERKHVLSWDCWDKKGLEGTLWDPGINMSLRPDK